MLLCGLDAQYRREQQLEGSQLRYLPASSGSSTEAQTAAAPQAEQQQQQPESGLAASCRAAGVVQLEADVLENEKELHGLLPPWPILAQLQQAGVSHTLLSAFAAEGDNAADAMQLATTVLKVLGASQAAGLLPSGFNQQQQLQVPCSWVGLVGRRVVDSTLF